MEEVSIACEQYEIEKPIIFSLINIESGFNKNAVSNKGAIGLMQILPSTAEEISQKIAIKSFDLKNEKDNILFGTFYFSQMMERFDDLTLALCAYNAGPTNVSNWLKSEKYSPDGKILTDIPFLETRGYVEKFYKNYKYYSKKIK